MLQPLVCSVCGKPYDGPTDRYVCPFCRGSIEPKLHLTPECEDKIDVLKKGSSNGIWGYRAFLPVENDLEPVSMGEGNTPLIACHNLGKLIGIDNLYIKNETMNPTATYKDRFATVDISIKKAAGIKSVALGSAGNAGSSVAAYAARAGMNCYVLLPDGPIKERAMQALSYGARFIQGEGHIDDFLNVVEQGVDEFGWANSCTTILHNPLGTEGYKTIAYEIGKDMEFSVPDWIFVPIGGGIILSKIWRGFTEMFDLGLIEKLPRMVGVQAEFCAPVVKAIEEGKSEPEFWENSHTIAGSIHDPLTFDGVTCVDAIRKSNGTAVAVTDDEIVEAMRICARKEAIIAEPASASTIAGAIKMSKAGMVKSNDTVVCIVTGSALRDLPLMTADRKDPPHIRVRNMDDTKAAIKFYEEC